MRLAPGMRAGPYVILSPLGSGGMGEVYRARDSRLGRDVALKVLPEAVARDAERLARFEREARAVAALNHPGIVVLYSVEEHEGLRLLTMELVEGERLDQLAGPTGLDLARLLDLGIGLSEALVAAHERGVVHRDLKPANVMVTRDGRVKVLDFGLAKLGGADSGLTQAPTVTPLSATGQTMGTAPYMAPEQLRGESVDARTDLFALGIILYELAAGRRPFGGATWASTVSAILNDAPQPLANVRADLPSDLGRIVGRCLEKDPRRRVQTALDVLNELRELKAAGRPPSGGMPVPDAGRAPAAGPAPAARSIRSLAVLPLENVSHDATQEYFADGMTEALISEMARLRELRVISRTSAMKYKGVHRALPEIARELGVDAVLEGSALLVRDRVRVTLQLVSAAHDQTLWTNRYDDRLEDVLDLQGRIAEAVAREIALQVTPQEAAQRARRRPILPEARLEYMRGRHMSADGSVQALELALRHYQRALELDPHYAEAMAAIARCHAARAVRGMVSSKEAYEAGRVAAARALEMDDSVPEAHDALATVAVWDLDLPTAVHHFERAVALDPASTNTLVGLGQVHYCMERHAQAQAAMLKALSCDPLSMMISTCVGDAYYYAREYERSRVYYQKAVELDPRFDGVHTDLARSLEALGRFEESRREYEQGRLMSGGVAGPSFGLAHLEASSGNVAGARSMLEQLIEARAHRVISAWGIAVMHASLGDVDEAFRWLDVAVEERATGLRFLRVHPRLDPIRPDPRFASLLGRLKLGRV